MLISKKYREYKKIIQQLSFLWKKKALEGRLSLSIMVFPPDKRKRDIDNLSKSVIDSLQNARLFLDDSQIDKLLIERKEIKKPGEVHVYIEEI